MMTYAEAIEALRAKREEMSLKIEALRVERQAVNEQLLALEEKTRVPKRGAALPGDIVMIAEPAQVKMAAAKKR